MSDKLTDEQALEQALDAAIAQFGANRLAVALTARAESAGKAVPVAWQTAFDQWWRDNRVKTHDIKGSEGFARKVWHAAVQSAAHPPQEGEAVEVLRELVAIDDAQKGEAWPFSIKMRLKATLQRARSILERHQQQHGAKT